MFKENNVKSDVFYSVGQWFGGEPSLVSPIKGDILPVSYPFKKYFLETDAPILENSRPLRGFGLPNSTVNIKIGIEKGDVYDLSRLEQERQKPIVATKRKDGSVRVITSSRNLSLTPAQLSAYKVPVIINGKPIEKFDFEKPEKNSLTLQLQFDASGNYVFNEKGKIWLLITRQKFSENIEVQSREQRLKFSKILSVEIISFQQLKAKGVFDAKDQINLRHPYLANKELFTFLNLIPKMGYIPLSNLSNIIREYGFQGGVDLSLYGNYFNKLYQESRNQSNTFVFSIFRDVNSPPAENYIDDIFIRI